MHVKDLIAEERVNTGRQLEVDALKAFSIIMMIITHCIDELFATYSDHFPSSLINDILAQTVGAQGFMICMGIGIIYSRHAKPKDMILRGVNILIIGQVLNLIRYGLVFTVTYLITGEEMARGYALLTFSSDILQFAGLFLILAGICMQLKFKPLHVFGIAVVLNIIAMGAAGHIHTGSYALDQFFGLFVFTETESYFPLLNWFIYPAFGMVFGDVLQHVTDKKKFYGLLAVPCVIVSTVFYIIAIGYEQPVFTVIWDWKSFCYMRLPDALATMFANMLMLIIFFFLSLHAHEKVTHCIKFISGNINRYYCVHSVLIYMLVSILLFFAGGFYTSAGQCYLTAAAVLALTTLIVIVYDRYLAKRLTAFFGKHTLFWYAVVILLSVVICVWAISSGSVFPSLANDYME